MDKPILTSYGLNYWWTIGANEVQFCHRRTNTYLTDLHRALAHSLKTRMGRGSIFLPEIRRDKFEYRKTKSEMQDWLVAQKIVQEILKEDEKKKEQLHGREKKIERIVDDGMQCRTEESSCAASFFVRIKIQVPCVQNNVHCICHSMFGRYIIISKRMMRKF